jgi:hypothetical protein
MDEYVPNIFMTRVEGIYLFRKYNEGSRSPCRPTLERRQIMGRSQCSLSSHERNFLCKGPFAFSMLFPFLLFAHTDLAGVYHVMAGTIHRI